MTTRYVVLGISIVLLVGGALSLIVGGGINKPHAQDVIDLQQGDYVHEGYRRAHSKGFCIRGEFNSTGALAAYSTAIVLRAGRYPFIGRISIGTNNPHAPDLSSPVRSLAITLLPNNPYQWRMAMNTPPVLAVATPEDFYQQLKAMGRKALPEFFKQHPESANYLAWQSSYQPTQSFASERYNSIHAFYLVNAKGNKQAVRWTMVPTISAGDYLQGASDDNALQHEFFKRLKEDSVVFDWLFTLANTGDKTNDATSLWPESNTTINAGTLVIMHAEPQATGICNDLVFDPLVLPAGVEASDDPILRARSGAYAESYRRRARETWVNGPAEMPANSAGERHE